MSVSFPPDQDPITDPIPKQAKMVPISFSEKPISFLRYNDKKGMTIAPALFTSEIREIYQISLESPLKDSI